MNKRTPFLLLSSAALLAACSAQEMQDFGAAGMLGAIAGCASAKATGGDCARGASYGAASGVATKLFNDMLIEHRARRLKDKEAVATAYKKEKGSAVPDQSEVTRYETSTEPDAVVEGGMRYILTSQIALLQGLKEPEVLLEEELQLYDNVDTDNMLRSVRKPVNEDSKTGGEFDNQFAFILPDGIPEGVYPVRTKVYVNGKEKRDYATAMQVVFIHHFPSQQRIASR